MFPLQLGTTEIWQYLIHSSTPLDAPLSVFGHQPAWFLALFAIVAETWIYLPFAFVVDGDRPELPPDWYER